jgi:hypothetical protein
MVKTKLQNECMGSLHIRERGGIWSNAMLVALYNKTQKFDKNTKLKPNYESCATIVDEVSAKFPDKFTKRREDYVEKFDDGIATFRVGYSVALLKKIDRRTYTTPPRRGSRSEKEPCRALMAPNIYYRIRSELRRKTDVEIMTTSSRIAMSDIMSSGVQ